MRTHIARFVIHALLTIAILATAAIVIGIANGAALHYGDDPLASHWDNDGPYVFYQGGNQLEISYVKGTQQDGFYLERREYPVTSSPSATSYYPLDSTRFDFRIQVDIQRPDVVYDDGQDILAISDIEGNFGALRDLLVRTNVVNPDLQWTFGRGHLVLVGDFVDRGVFVIQVLWLIHKLEQEAEAHGGRVHYIIGNHELKAMQGNHESASPKYYHIAAMLEKQQYALYDSSSFLGRWMESKNAVESINGNVFVHGGLHPDLADSGLDLEQINEVMRSNYRRPFYPRRGGGDEQLLVSTKTGPSWYRGYFKEDLTQQQIDRTLDRFHAKTVVVGHTIQGKVNRRFAGRVIGIDVRHPSDDHKNWPQGKSEALLIMGDAYYRVLADGSREQI